MNFFSVHIVQKFSPISNIVKRDNFKKGLDSKKNNKIKILNAKTKANTHC